MSPQTMFVSYNNIGCLICSLRDPLLSRVLLRGHGSINYERTTTRAPRLTSSKHHAQKTHTHDRQTYPTYQRPSNYSNATPSYPKLTAQPNIVCLSLPPVMIVHTQCNACGKYSCTAVRSTEVPFLVCTCVCRVDVSSSKFS